MLLSESKGKKMANENVFKELSDVVTKDDTLSEESKAQVLRNITKMQDQKINLMITGATGCGKSSTINALFNANVAKVGQGVDPQTMDIAKFDLDNLTLWDSPGLGDGKEQDIKHSKAIISKLNEKDANGDALIDLVLVILDGSTRDYGTSFHLIEEVIIPAIGKDAKNRVLIAINQADMAMKGRGWDEAKNAPTPELAEFLDKKVASVQKRIKDSTGVDIEPIYYCAGYKDGDKAQKPYNLSKLLYFIVSNTKKEKRALYINNISRDKTMWESNDELKNYNKEIQNSLWESVKDGASEGADIGGKIGGLFGETGRKIGTVVGGTVGAVYGFFKGIFS